MGWMIFWSIVIPLLLAIFPLILVAHVMDEMQKSKKRKARLAAQDKVAKDSGER